MAEIFKFPDRDEWADIDRTIAEKMRAEGLDGEIIETVCKKVRAYTEKYLNFDFDFDLGTQGFAPEVTGKVAEAFSKSLQAQLRQFVFNIFHERISTEIALALD